MNMDFTFEIGAELAHCRRSMFKLSLKGGHDARKLAYETEQMANFLEMLARSPFPRYPVRVTHTSKCVPDFQLTFGKRRIAVELTRIKSQDLEHARALQPRLKRTITLSNLLALEEGPRTRQRLIQDGFARPALVPVQSTDDQERQWQAQAMDSLDSKTAVITGSKYVHGDEDWLVILDSFGIIDFTTRPNGFSALLV
jgi:hypothetical protein